MLVKIPVEEKSTKNLPLRKITYGKSVDIDPVDEYTLFQAIDKDNDGFIPVEELNEAILVATDLFGLTLDEAKQLIHDVDSNRDGKIDFPEFCTLMAKAKKMHMRRIVIYAAQSVLGRSQQAEALRYITPYHNCSPPPVFMIVISLIQIASYLYFKSFMYDLDVWVPKSSITTTEPTSHIDYSTAMPDYSDDGNETWTTTKIYVYVGNGTENENETEIVLVEKAKLYCDSILDLDTERTNSWTKCAFFIYLEVDPDEKWQIWRYFTYMFLHQNLDHLLGNVGIQLLLGVPLELVHKVQRIAPIYILGSICGALLYVSFETVRLIGASAGVYALVGAHVANVIINWSEMKFHWLRFAFTILILIKVLNEIAAVFVRNGDNVGHLAHIGGFIGGFLLAIIFLKNLKLQKWEKFTKISSIVMFIMYCAGCIVFMIINSNNGETVA